MSHNAKMKHVFGVTLETVVRRILKTYDRASKSDVEAGALWYAEAGMLAAELAAGSTYDLDQCAAVISHLSPRLHWGRNVFAATTLLTTGILNPGVMNREGNKAISVLNRGGYEDPLDSFKGNKTRRFYLNILGDREAVTVDVWAMKAAGLDEDGLKRKGAYDAVEHAYRLAARRRSVDPATMQSTCWIVARGGRAK